MSDRAQPSRNMWIVVIAALVLGVAALGLSGWTLLRTQLTSTHEYTDAQVSDDTKKACAAYELASRGAKLQSSPAVPNDASGPLALAANARIALIVASKNPVIAADASPAAPTALTSTMRSLADAYRAVASNDIGGSQADSPEIKAAFQSGDEAEATMRLTCKP